VQFDGAIDDVGMVIDAVGVAVIVGGIVVAGVLAGTHGRADRLRGTERRAAGLPGERGGVYDTFRQRIGRAILLGLELLVAADIIKTVAATPTLDSIAILASIVLIRTFLSLSLQVEVTGRWPWQHAPRPDAGKGAPPAG
jgi:hypothetical protein